MAECTVPELGIALGRKRSMVNHKSTLPTVTILAFAWIWFAQTHTDAILTLLKGFTVVKRYMQILSNQSLRFAVQFAIRPESFCQGPKPLDPPTVPTNRHLDDAPQIMLKTSPALSASANASPTAFRYATSSPQHSSKPSPALRRRPSTRSDTPSSADAMKSSPIQRPRQYVANDSGIHGSPEVQRPPPSISQKASAHPAQSPAPSRPSQDQAVQQGQGQALSGVSPTKRRSSPTPTNLGAVAAANSSPQTSKRAKPATPPPKVLPDRYELCAVEDMVELVAHMLAELIATNDAIRISNGGLTRFHSRTAPGISVRDYLHRLARHATLTPPLLLAMVYYIDRLCAMYQEFTINTLTVHRFLITAATVAAKGLSDSFWNNTTYARVGGVRVAELKLLELEFLYRVDWKIVPNPEVLVAYYKGLVERTPGYVLESDGSDDEDEDEDDDPEDGENEPSDN
ncbi:phosphate system cyclin PHO80 [Fusarium pseudocircinatum]|uniref:Phosphate system cyclin PHO80 n=1 Tax=Fusarium pseudocircinatum TaxID=56676 RepID=A0A8H5PL97_9HYPO|nr:phosphate system cyclin PHO80 [Fusarium pseudocircinatum]